MPANLVWIQRPYIVCVEYSGEVSQEEILQTTADALEIVERRPTYFLIDAAEVLAYPKNLVNFFYSRESTVQFIQHVNTRAIALVHGAPSLRMALEIIMRNRIYSAFDDREVALAFLRKTMNDDQSKP